MAKPSLRLLTAEKCVALARLVIEADEKENLVSPDKTKVIQGPGGADKTKIIRQNPGPGGTPQAPVLDTKEFEKTIQGMDDWIQETLKHWKDLADFFVNKKREEGTNDSYVLDGPEMSQVINGLMAVKYQINKFSDEQKSMKKELEKAKQDEKKAQEANQ